MLTRGSRRNKLASCPLIYAMLLRLRMTLRDEAPNVPFVGIFMSKAIVFVSSLALMSFTKTVSLPG